MFVRIIHIENDTHGRFTGYRPVGGFHNCAVGAENVADSHRRRRVAALFEPSIAAHGVNNSAFSGTKFLRLGQSGQLGVPDHQQLQRAVAVAAFGSDTLLGEGEQAHAVLPRQVKTVLVVLVS